VTVGRPPEQGRDRPPEQGSWWSDWGESVGFLVLGIIGVVAAMLIALLLVVII
jgi:hypothetical protein